MSKSKHEEFVLRLKKAIKEEENDKQINSIKWIANFHKYDDINESVIRLGVRQERHLFKLYYDFDLDDADGVSTSEEEMLMQIKERWGYLDTFKFINPL